MGRNPKKTPSHARNPEKRESEEMWRKGEEYRNTRKINTPRQLYQAR